MDATISKTSDPQQATEGIYVYCIIESPEPRMFGKVGISAGARLTPVHGGGG